MRCQPSRPIKKAEKIAGALLAAPTISSASAAGKKSGYLKLPLNLRAAVRVTTGWEPNPSYLAAGSSLPAEVLDRFRHELGLLCEDVAGATASASQLCSISRC